MTSAIDPNFITTDPVSKSGMRTQLQTAKDEISALQTSATTLSSAKFDKAGGTITGDIWQSKASPAFTFRRSAAGQNVSLTSQIGTATRWALLFGNATAESGFNVGSDIVLSRYSDAGALLAAVFTITRSTGVVAFTESPTGPTRAVGNDTTSLATTAFVQNELDQQIRRGIGTTTNGVGSVTISPAFSTSIDNIQLTVAAGSGALTAGAAIPLVVGATPTTAGFNVYGDVTQSVSFYWVAVGR
jgi:hypothetical protein